MQAAGAVQVLAFLGRMCPFLQCLLCQGSKRGAVIKVGKLHLTSPAVIERVLSLMRGLLLQGFIRVSDLQNLTYAADRAATLAGGETVEQLEVRGTLLGKLLVQCVYFFRYHLCKCINRY